MPTGSRASFTVSETVEVARAPEDVWGFIADHANDPQWCPKVRSVEPAGAGRWRVTHKPVPLRPPATLDMEQLELDPPRRLVLREEDDASVFRVEYRLEASEAGTRFTQTSEFEWKRLPWVLSGLFAQGVRRDVRRQLQELRRILEAG